MTVSERSAHRVPVPSGKSWNFFCKIYRPWKVLENDYGRGNRGNLSQRSWNLLGHGHNEEDTKMVTSANL